MADQDDFEAAFSGEQPEEVQQQQQEPAQVEQPAPLPTLDPQLISMLSDQVARQVENTIGNRLRNVEGHIGGLKHEMARVNAPPVVPTTEQVTAAIDSGVKLKQLKEDFPEWAEAIEETANNIMGKMPKQVDTSKLESAVVTAGQDAVRHAYLARQMARLDILQPDWEQTIRSQEYQTWLAQQPRELQALTSSENATDALRVLDAFAAHAGRNPDLTATSRQSSSRRLESAVAPTTGRAPTRGIQKSDHDEFLEAFTR